MGNRQRREAVAGLAGMDVDTAGIEMIRSREHLDPALIHALDTYAVGGPHLVLAVRLDRTSVQHTIAL
ncbi:MAG TPA: hypothetical protein PLI90_06390, partial [Rhodocyclaceae bacterium]|nr:hypothetical protein [Rhodocyclaceae bacterium]